MAAFFPPPISFPRLRRRFPHSEHVSPHPNQIRGKLATDKYAGKDVPKKSARKDLPAKSAETRFDVVCRIFVGQREAIDRSWCQVSAFGAKFP